MKALAIVAVLSIALCGVASADEFGHIYWGSAGASPNGHLKMIEQDGSGGILTVTTLYQYSANGQPRALAVDENNNRFYYGGEDGSKDGRMAYGSIDTHVAVELGFMSPGDSDTGDWPSQGQIGADGKYYMSGNWNELNIGTSAGVVTENYNPLGAAGSYNTTQFFDGGDRTMGVAVDTANDVIYGGNRNDWLICAYTLSTGVPITPASSSWDGGNQPGQDYRGRPNFIHLNRAMDTIYCISDDGERFTSMSTADIQAGTDYNSPGSSWHKIQDGETWKFFDIAIDGDGVEKVFFVENDNDIWKIDLDDVDSFVWTGNAGGDYTAFLALSTFVVNASDGNDVRAFYVTDSEIVPEPAGLGLLGIALLGLRKRRS